MKYHLDISFISSTVCVYVFVCDGVYMGVCLHASEYNTTTYDTISETRTCFHRLRGGLRLKSTETQQKVWIRNNTSSHPLHKYGVTFPSPLGIMMCV